MPELAQRFPSNPILRAADVSPSRRISSCSPFSVRARFDFGARPACCCASPSGRRRSPVGLARRFSIPSPTAAAAACGGCHGETGVSATPGTPSLVGFDEKYFVAAMNAYRSGQRRHELMQSIAAATGEADLRHLALHYALQKPAPAQTPANGNAAAGKAAATACASWWIVLMGGHGTGKTHLAAAIANYRASQGYEVMLVPAPDLLDHLRAAFDAEDTTFDERFDQIRRAPLLVLDDFGTQSATEWAREKLFQILNYRYINRLPTVLTTNLALDELEGRIRSRLNDSDLVRSVRIHSPDYRHAAEDINHHELSSLALHAKQTFGTFNLREDEGLPPEDLRSLKKAFEAARKFAEDPDGWIVLMGGHGTGKTHLAAAI